MLRNEDWRSDAACRGMPTELFFEDNGKRINSLVERTCNSCYVRDQCRQYAIDNDEEFGVWGGISQGALNAEKRKATRKPTTEFPDCGTVKSYKQHLAKNQLPCAKCRRAYAIYRRDYRGRKRVG